jgi:hypothetical protein
MCIWKRTFRNRTLQERARFQSTSYSILGRHFRIVIFENVCPRSGRSSGIRERQPSPARERFVMLGSLRSATAVPPYEPHRDGEESWTGMPNACQITIFMIDLSTLRTPIIDIHHLSTRRYLSCSNSRLL